jgi:uncharacterized protein (DUF305 family)
VLAGCGTVSGPGSGGSAAEIEAPVIVPGAPGEEARVMSGAEAAERRAPSPASPADVVFVEMMIPHHEQALEMAALAPGRAADPRVAALAERIAAAQGPEIAVMRAWLERLDPALAGHAGKHGGDHGGGHASMPGMATPEQLTALAAASGPAFDALFLDLMTVHHEGALAMAQEVRATGTDLAVGEMAQNVVADQSAEIERMAGLRPPAG